VKHFIWAVAVAWTLLTSQAHAQWAQINAPHGGEVPRFAVSDTNLFAGRHQVCLE
jgi:hypothetical protein